MELPEDWNAEPVAVMASGGLDSAVLLHLAAACSPRVTPIYVRLGLRWEPEEEAALRRYLRLVRRPNLAPLRVFDIPVGNIYGAHWSTIASGVPDAESADEEVYLPGRNLLLLVQAALWCHLHDTPTIALGPLRGNPFPDTAPGFFAALEEAVARSVGARVRMVCPLRSLDKVDILRLGADLPLAATLSCLQPVAGQHCGACNKCAERQRGFAAAGLADPTAYAATPSQSLSNRG